MAVAGSCVDWQCHPQAVVEIGSVCLVDEVVVNALNPVVDVVGERLGVTDELEVKLRRKHVDATLREEEHKLSGRHNGLSSKAAEFGCHHCNRRVDPWG